jgi:hypothetical protein
MGRHRMRDGRLNRARGRSRRSRRDGLACRRPRVSRRENRVATAAADETLANLDKVDHVVVLMLENRLSITCSGTSASKPGELTLTRGQSSLRRFGAPQGTKEPQEFQSGLPGTTELAE